MISATFEQIRINLCTEVNGVLEEIYVELENVKENKKINNNLDVSILNNLEHSIKTVMKKLILIEEFDYLKFLPSAEKIKINFNQKKKNISSFINNFIIENCLKDYEDNDDDEISIVESEKLFRLFFDHYEKITYDSIYKEIFEEIIGVFKEHIIKFLENFFNEENTKNTFNQKVQESIKERMDLLIKQLPDDYPE